MQEVLIGMFDQLKNHLDNEQIIALAMRVEFGPEATAAFLAEVAETEEREEVKSLMLKPLDLIIDHFLDCGDCDATADECGVVRRQEVRTREAMRELVMGLGLTSEGHDCQGCPANGNCPLQEMGLTVPIQESSAA